MITIFRSPDLSRRDVTITCLLKTQCRVFGNKQQKKMASDSSTFWVLRIKGEVFNVVVSQKLVKLKYLYQE